MLRLVSILRQKLYKPRIDFEPGVLNKVEGNNRRSTFLDKIDNDLDDEDEYERQLKLHEQEQKRLHNVVRECFVQKFEYDYLLKYKSKKYQNSGFLEFIIYSPSPSSSPSEPWVRV